MRDPTRVPRVREPDLAVDEVTAFIRALDLDGDRLEHGEYMSRYQGPVQHGGYQVRVCRGCNKPFIVARSRYDLTCGREKCDR